MHECLNKAVELKRRLGSSLPTNSEDGIDRIRKPLAIGEKELIAIESVSQTARRN